MNNVYQGRHHILIVFAFAAMLAALVFPGGSCAFAAQDLVVGEGESNLQGLMTSADDLDGGDAADGVFIAESGWSLRYEVSTDGTATITGVASVGSGDTLTVPSNIDGHSVVAIGAKAFYNDDDVPTTGLAKIILPSTITTLGVGAFMSSGLASITVPSSVEAIPARCFAGCSKLATITFAGDSLKNIGEMAFSGCAALMELDIPVLTQNIARESFRVGRKCFYRCSKLENLIFRGDASTKSQGYISNIDCFEYCTSLKNLVYYCNCSTIPKGTDSSNTSVSDGVNVYQTMWFYGSVDDAHNNRNPAYHITCLRSTSISDILANKVSREDILDDKGQFKAKPVWDEGGTWSQAPAGKIWGVIGSTEEVKEEDGTTTIKVTGAISGTDAKLANTYKAALVPNDSLQFCWVSSETIDDYREKHPSSYMNSNNDPIYYIDNAGKVSNISDLKVFGPGGAVVPASAYNLVFQKEIPATERATPNTYEALDGVPGETGTFRVRAEGVSSTNKGTVTSWVYIRVMVFSPTVVSYSDESLAARLARASQEAAGALKERLSQADEDAAELEKPKTVVVVPSSDWRYQLIGSGLAGAGHGVMLFDNGEDYSSRTLTAFIESGLSAVQIVGSAKVVPESSVPSSGVYLMDYLNMRELQNKTRYSKDSTIQELADQVYVSIRSLKNKGNTVYGDGWGKTAIVASPNEWFGTLPIAQYAYTEQAPVFFVGQSGLLSTADMDYLKNDGFENVVIAGDTSYVSEACANAIEQACSIKPKRLFHDGANAADATIACAGSLSGDPEAVVIASTENAANVVAASALAGAKKGIALTCSCTADSKLIQSYLRSYIAKHGQSSVASIYLVGDMSKADGGLLERMKAMWTEPQSSTISAGDIIATRDFSYTVASAANLRLTDVSNKNATSLTFKGFMYGKKAQKITSIEHSAVSACTKLERVTFKAGATGIGASTFKSHPTLQKVQMGDNVKTIDASTFAGCPVLTSVTGSAVKSVGIRAFANCPKLQTCAPLRTTKMVAAQAFMGCTSLVSVSASKATSVGARAFSGCSKLTAAVFPKANIMGNAVFQDCKRLMRVSAPAVKKVNQRLFSNCAKLKKVELTKCTTLGARAFTGCAALKTVIFPRVATVGVSAFQDCKQLRVALFAASGLKKVGARAFFGCKRLKALTFKTKKLTAGRVGSKAFAGLPKSVYVRVPKAKVTGYATLFVKRGLPAKATVGWD